MSRDIIWQLSITHATTGLILTEVPRLRIVQSKVLFIWLKDSTEVSRGLCKGLCPKITRLFSLGFVSVGAPNPLYITDRPISILFLDPCNIYIWLAKQWIERKWTKTCRGKWRPAGLCGLTNGFFQKSRILESACDLWTLSQHRYVKCKYSEQGRSRGVWTVECGHP